MGYGESTTAGLTAAGLRAWNSVEPVSKAEYAGADAAASSGSGSVEEGMPPQSKSAVAETRVAEDDTVWVEGANGWEMLSDEDAAALMEAAGAEAAADAPAVGEVGPVEVCDAYLYPSLTPGDYGERTDAMGHRDVNDYEMYFSFLRGAAATETEPREPDAMYLGFDSAMYSDERAKVRLSLHV